MSAGPLEGDARATLSKREWRRAIIEAIAGLDPGDRRSQEASLAEALPRLPGWHEARIVLLYVSAFPEEVPTGPLLAMAYEAGKRVILPRVDRRERRLRLHRVIDPGASWRRAYWESSSRTRPCPRPPPIPSTGPSSPGLRSTTADTDWAEAPGTTTASCQPCGPTPSAGRSA